MKKPVFFLAATALIAAGLVGCQRARDDEALIKDLLMNSYFTGTGSDGVTDDASTNPNGVSGSSALLAADIEPGKWARKLDSVSRDVQVDVSGDSAYATITCYLTGRIYIDTIPGNNVLDTISRPFADSTYRNVTLRWNSAKERWAIEKITPVMLYTPGAAHPMQIEKIEISAKPSNVAFTIDDPAKFYGIEDLPWFQKGDTVTVTLTAKQLAAADTGWAYLHHGRHFRKATVGHRNPFVKESTLVFTGTWLIADDNVAAKISVRHAAFDLIYWGTLSSDPAAEYSAYALGLPYVVTEPGQTLPDDGSTDNE